MMCNCGKNECSFCTNQLNHWVRWCEYVQWLTAKQKPHTRDELGIRLGQGLFNVLWYYRPDVANKIRGSLDDPFYDDDKIRSFLKKVDELWTV